MFSKTKLATALCLSVSTFAMISVAFAQEAGTTGQHIVDKTHKTLQDVKEVIDSQSDDLKSTEQASLSNIALSDEDNEQQLQVQAENKVKLHQLLGDQKVVFADELAKIYGEHNFQPLWDNTQATQSLMRQIVPWVLSGVSNQAMQQFAAISDSHDKMQRDILLSDTFLNYLYYVQNVRSAQHHWLYGNSGYKAMLPDQSSISAWSRAITEDNTKDYIQALEPSNTKYKATVNRILSSLPTDEIVELPSVSQTLRPGEHSVEVKDLATILKNKGFYSGSTNEDVYNAALVEAVKAFQASRGLSADGVVGANTRLQLNPVNISAGNNLYKLAINAQRLRVLPNEVNGIFVNIPTYQLNYYRNGQLVLNSKVIVGKKARPTPVLTSRLSNVVVNPPWNAPTRLINEDLIPKVRRDPSYIYRNGYTIVDGKGRTIDPYTIDWENMTAKKFPYRLRQAPGGDSALGSFKFNMPSADAIYLHDTPSRGLFSRSNRALSSGCVRVHKADELATLLLNENGWTTARKQQVLASKKTTSTNLSKRDDVYLYYVTMWVDGDGEIHTAPDIYNHDRKLGKTNINWANIKKDVI